MEGVALRLEGQRSENRGRGWRHAVYVGTWVGSWTLHAGGSGAGQQGSLMVSMEWDKDLLLEHAGQTGDLRSWSRGGSQRLSQGSQAVLKASATPVVLEREGISS